jgi:hypothetical protein
MLPLDMTLVPHSPKTSSADINKEWESKIVPPYPNPFLVNDPLNSIDLEEAANKLYRDWDSWDV